MSAFDDWLAAKGKSRDAAAALDEILWLRTERQRLRLTDAEREAIADAADRYAEITPESAETAAVLRGLLNRTDTGGL